MKYYKATRSRNQGRESWSVIFRHPVRNDPASGKPGRRVRRGLGTTDDNESSRLVDELNQLLSTEQLWEPSARSAAAGRFDPRVVEIFYDGLEASRTDFVALREDLVPLPTRRDGYTRVLLLGTTGAGKTTVVRQLLGTDPESERFPSTSTAKTTVADTELVTTDNKTYRAAVTFTPRDEVIEYLTENVSAAALAILRGRDGGEITRRMLDHVNQRFRLSYVLGRGAVTEDDDVDDDDIDLEPVDSGSDATSAIDLSVTVQVISSAVEALRGIVEKHRESVISTLGSIDEDERVVSEFVEEELDAELRQSDEFHNVVDSLVDEVEKRFDNLDFGVLRRNRQSWPMVWHWESDDRAAFIKVVSRFSSNYAPLFGNLLTPLVNGIRVSGPFKPDWAQEPVRLVLVDGEGLGHTPKSAATLSTHVVAQLEEVDAVLLVDNATQPMQAAPVAAIKSVTVSGNAPKLHFLFTHFDQVDGDNLPTFSAREEHVLASVENTLRAIGDELGPAAERVLRGRIDKARFFVGNIQDPLNPKKKTGSRAIGQFGDLLSLLSHTALAAESGPSKPVFDRMNLSLAVTEAAKAFHARWRGLLGITMNVDAPREHWGRVKALTRRLSEGWTDHYESLQPAADLRNQLQVQVYLMLQRPVRWEGGEPSDDDKQIIIDNVTNAVTKRLTELTRKRVVADAQPEWQRAYAERGPGSTFTRAKIVAHDVLDRSAPIPTVSASPDQNRFLKDVAALISEVADECGVILE